MGIQMCSYVINSFSIFVLFQGGYLLSLSWVDNFEFSLGIIIITTYSVAEECKMMIFLWSLGCSTKSLKMP